jgi:aminoglycoside phosphotransferase (APT) family kinase protein
VELERIAQRLNGALVRSWLLEGGVSAQTTAIEVGSRVYVVREHGTAPLEFRLLRALEPTGIPVPHAHLLDEEGRYVVLDYVESEPAPPGPDVALALADALAEIHGLDVTELSFLPTLDEPGVLLHGDLWPGNVLWHEGQIAAIVDWEDAAIGDPLRDLAVSRLELLWAYGREELDDFTERYRRARPHVELSALPARDLEAAERLTPQLQNWGVDPETEATMRERAEAFAAEARQRLRGR